MTRPEAVHVVVPARDEAELIATCLASVRVAVDRLRSTTGLHATVTVVADSCTDATAEVAGHHGADVVVVRAGSVGGAREAGVRRVLALSPTADAARTWIAMTDADSVVPRRWLEEQVRAATLGTTVWVGSVHPDPTSLATPALDAWSARHGDPDELHVHGANLGFTASAFLQVGGFAPLVEHEDVTFVRAAVAAGCSWAVGAASVRTSSRVDGRTPGGFAGYLRRIVADLDGDTGADAVPTAP